MRCGSKPLCWVGALLAKYGFTELINPHDCVSVPSEAVLQGMAAIAGEAAADKARVLLETRQDVWGDAAIEGFELTHSGNLPSALVFLVQMSLPDCNVRSGSAALLSRARDFSEDSDTDLVANPRLVLAHSWCGP